MPEPDPEEMEKKVFVKYLPHRSTEEREMEVLVVHIKSPEPCWMDPVLAYLKDGTLPREKNEAKRVQYRAANYTLVDGVLYKRSYSLPLLLCLLVRRREAGTRQTPSFPFLQDQALAW